MMSNKRILVVDDDPGILASLQLLLEDAGYEVQTSTRDGEVIQQLLQTQAPDLILLDILLSGHDGRTICKNLKSHEDTRHIPIILMSAHPNSEAMSEEAGADSFLAKPFDMDVLLEQIEMLI
jgi:two-component system alkaline phosphatase synthesis response regulator PhoP